MRPCAALIFTTQLLIAFGIATGYIAAGPPTTAAILAGFLLIHALSYSGIL